MNQHAPEALVAPDERTANRSMQLYFRYRRNGPIVFRMEVANRQRRIELNQIAVLRRDGEIVPHKRNTPTDAEMAEIARWWATWRAKFDADELTDADKFLMEVNQFADHIQRKATDEEIDAEADQLLMGLMDLRQVIVRRLSKLSNKTRVDLED